MLGGKVGRPSCKSTTDEVRWGEPVHNDNNCEKELGIWGARGTPKDIAAAVGVSPATVSLVLNDKPVRISSERREQILNVASSMHYRPNQTARAAT